MPRGLRLTARVPGFPALGVGHSAWKAPLENDSGPPQLPHQHSAAQLLGYHPLQVPWSSGFSSVQSGQHLRVGSSYELHSTPTDEETPSPLCPTFMTSSNGDIIIFYITIFTGNYFLPKSATGKSALLQPTCTSWNKRVCVSTPATHLPRKSTLPSLLKKGCLPLVDNNVMLRLCQNSELIQKVISLI